MRTHSKRSALTTREDGIPIDVAGRRSRRETDMQQEGMAKQRIKT
jgi:hypothetical protein